MLVKRNLLSGKRKYLWRIATTHVYLFDLRGFQYGRQ